MGFVGAAWWIQTGDTLGFTLLFKTGITAFNYAGWQSIYQATCTGRVGKLLQTANVAGATMLGVHVETTRKKVFVFFAFPVVFQTVPVFFFGLL